MFLCSVIFVNYMGHAWIAATFCIKLVLQCFYTLSWHDSVPKWCRIWPIYTLLMLRDLLITWLITWHAVIGWLRIIGQRMIHISKLLLKTETIRSYDNKWTPWNGHIKSPSLCCYRYVFTHYDHTKTMQIWIWQHLQIAKCNSEINSTIFAILKWLHYNCIIWKNK